MIARIIGLALMAIALEGLAIDQIISDGPEAAIAENPKYVRAIPKEGVVAPSK